MMIQVILLIICNYTKKYFKINPLIKLQMNPLLKTSFVVFANNN